MVFTVSIRSIVIGIAAFLMLAPCSLRAEELTQRNVERAVFLVLPEVAYDTQLLADALAQSKSNPSISAWVGKIDFARLSHIRKTRIEWLERHLPALEREYEQEVERLRRAGIDPARSAVQFPLASIVVTVTLPPESALDAGCDRRTISLESVRHELSLSAQLSHTSAESQLLSFVSQPIWDEIDLKGGFRELQGADPHIKHDVVRRAVWLHLAKFGNEETLDRALGHIADNHSESDWIRALRPKIKAEFQNLKKQRKDWLADVIKALEQPGGKREFQLPKVVWVAGQSVRLQGRMYLSPEDLPRLRLEQQALKANVSSNDVQNLRNAVVAEVSRQIIAYANQSATDVVRLRAKNTADPTGKKDATGREIFNWTISLDGCKEHLEKVDHVIYRLHPTFSRNVFEINRKAVDDDFAFAASGWGRFLVRIDVVFRDGSTEKVEHWLQW